MKRRFFALLLVAVLSLSLAACGGTSDGTAGSSGSDIFASVTDTEGGDVSSQFSDLPSDTAGAGETDAVTDDSGSGADSGDASTDDSEEDPETPSDDYSQGGADAPDENGDAGDGADVYLPGYQPSTDDSESSSSSANNNSSTSDRNTNTAGSSSTNTSSDNGDRVVDTTLKGLMAITDQKNASIAVVDLSVSDITSSAALVWEWNPRKYGDVPYRSSDRHLDDVVLREVHGGLFNGTVVGVTSSSGLVAVVEYPSGKCLFNANAAGYGPHDIEILPNGLVAVACSGNSNADNSRVRIYRARSKTDSSYVEVSDVASAHGVLWDPTDGVLWALGGNTLNAYKIGGSPSSTPTITLIRDKGTGGFSGGHCLSPVYGNPDRLWLSVGSVVYQFSKSKNRLYSDYPGNSRISIRNVKSVNNYANGTAVWTVADPNNGTATHNTNTVDIMYYEITASGQRNVVYEKVKFSNRDFYKVRVFDAAYQ